MTEATPVTHASRLPGLQAAGRAAHASHDNLLRREPCWTLVIQSSLLSFEPINAPLVRFNLVCLLT